MLRASRGYVGFGSDSEGASKKHSKKIHSEKAVVWFGSWGVAQVEGSRGPRDQGHDKNAPGRSRR
eukprot:10229623-Karenia_brevis.AAC.1